MMPDMVCTVLGNDLHVGSFDSGSNTDVTKLQTLLSAEGYFPYQPIGIFGPLTFHAAQRFQAANGVRTTGYVGPITRGVIQSVSCGSPTPVPSPTVSMGILSISPISGPVGTTVSLTGYGFTSDNTILFANGAIRNVPITRQSLSRVLPLGTATVVFVKRSRSQFRLPSGPIVLPDQCALCICVSSRRETTQSLFRTQTAPAIV
jgi:peptidoglycan hydrolase-like protein with peptidoglycan-binding domain